jgi:hypothetical protein
MLIGPPDNKSTEVTPYYLALDFSFTIVVYVLMVGQSVPGGTTLLKRASKYNGTGDVWV